MDIQKAFTFVTEDKDWVTKLGIGVLLGITSFLMVPMFMLIGYGIHVARNVKDSAKNPLPDWDFGQTLKDGFLVWVATLIYSLPILVLMVIGIVVGGGVDALIGGDGGAAAGILAIFGCILFLYSILLMMITPAIYIQYIRYGNLGATLNFSEVWATTRSQLSNIIISIIALIVISIVIGVFSLILNIIPCLGTIASFVIALAMIPYMQMVVGHLYGQIAQKVDNKAHF